MYTICIVCELDVVETEDSFHVVSGDKDRSVLHRLEKRSDSDPQTNEKQLHQNLRESLRQKAPNRFSLVWG